MKKFYALTAAFAVSAVCMAAPAAKSPFPLKERMKTDRTAFSTVPGRMHKAPARAEESAPVFRPEFQTTYYPDETGSGWIESELYKTQWDKQGRPVRDVITSNDGGAVAVYEYEYNEYGSVILQKVYLGTTEEDAELTDKIETKYDEKMPWLETSHLSYMYQNGEWILDEARNNYRNVVTRNDAGNVVSVLRQTLSNADTENYEWYDNEKFEATYGADGKPVKVGEYSYDSYAEEWSVDGEYENLVWDAFTGQISSVETCFEKGNRLVNFTEKYEEDDDMNVQVLYLDENNFVMYIDMEGNPLYMLTTLLPNGGFRQTEYGEISFEGITLTIGSGYVESIDELNNILLSAEYEFDPDGITEVYSWMEGTNTPLAEYGNMPSQYILRTFYSLEEDEEEMDLAARVKALGKKEAKKAPARITAADLPDFSKFEYSELPETISGEWENFIRIDFSGYNKVSGICLPETEATDAHAEYYTIDGRKVSAPAEGLYIVCQGGKATKVIR